MNQFYMYISVFLTFLNKIFYSHNFKIFFSYAPHTMLAIIVTNLLVCGSSNNSTE